MMGIGLSSLGLSQWEQWPKVTIYSPGYSKRYTMRPLPHVLPCLDPPLKWGGRSYVILSWTRQGPQENNGINRPALQPTMLSCTGVDLCL